MNKHLSNLQKVADDVFDSGEKGRKFKRFLEERANDIRSAPEIVKTAYWCDKCKSDVEGSGFKQIRMPNDSVWFAFYKGFCPKGHTLIRYITDTLTDPYFWKSEVVKRQRSEFEDLLLTPENPRFKEVYPQQWAELQLRKQGVILDT